MQTSAVRAFSVTCLLSSLSTWASAVNPGVDIAAPRVAISNTGDYFGFTPASIVVEQGDYTRWNFIGTSYSYTTTSGSVCNVASGLWDAPLNSLSPSSPGSSSRHPSRSSPTFAISSITARYMG